MKAMKTAYKSGGFESSIWVFICLILSGFLFVLFYLISVDHNYHDQIYWFYICSDFFNLCWLIWANQCFEPIQLLTVVLSFCMAFMQSMLYRWNLHCIWQTTGMPGDTAGSPVYELTFPSCINNNWWKLILYGNQVLDIPFALLFYEN